MYRVVQKIFCHILKKKAQTNKPKTKSEDVHFQLRATLNSNCTVYGIMCTPF